MTGEPCCLVKTVAGLTVGAALHPPNRMEALVEPLLATTKSCVPSLLKSPMATEIGWVPALISFEPLKPQSISQPNGDIVQIYVGYSRSCLPSLLKSPRAIDRGLLPTLI